MSRGRPLAGAACVGVLLLGAYLTTHFLDGSSRRLVAAEAERTARDAASRAKDALAAQAESVAVMAHNAVAAGGGPAGAGGSADPRRSVPA